MNYNINIDKILLIAPPAFTFRNFRDINPLPPMGLGYLASVVENMGIEVKILDCLIRGWENEENINDTMVRVGLSYADIENYIREFNPDLIGINCQFSKQYKIYHEMFSLIKRVKPNCITVAGGPHVSVCPDEVLKDSCCDFIIIGEGEESFKDLIIALNESDNFNSIDGIGWKSKEKVNINEKKRWINDIDSIPFPAYHLMDLHLYFGLTSSHGLRHKKHFSPIMTSRGCPAKCTFCSAHKVWGRKYRMRSVENVIEEMRILKEKFGIEELMFEDDNVTANAKRAKQLFSSMIEEKFNFVWDTPNGVGVWSLTEELIDIMKESGCIRLNFPVESGSQRVLTEIIKKPLNLNKVKRLIQHCRRIGLDYGMFLVIGLPGETIDDIWSSIRFAAECGCYNPHISVATPYPGTKLFDLCTDQELFSREFRLDDLFVKSFLIKTTDWNENDLRKIFIKSKLYLLMQEIIHNPFSLIRKRFYLFTRPLSYYFAQLKVVQKNQDRP